MLNVVISERTKQDKVTIRLVECLDQGEGEVAQDVLLFCRVYQHETMSKGDGKDVRARGRGDRGKRRVRSAVRRVC
jgi:hypothetical protein